MFYIAAVCGFIYYSTVPFVDVVEKSHYSLLREISKFKSWGGGFRGCIFSLINRGDA